jgi:biuret amidohydrolase
MTAAAPGYVDGYTRQFRLSPADTALVIIDVQYASGSRHHGLGKLLAAAGTLADAEYRFSRVEKCVVPNSKRLADAFRAMGAKVIYVTVGCTLPDFSDGPPQLRSFFVATDNRAGSREHEIVDELKPQANDLVLNKNTMGAFASTGIDTHLKSMGIRNIAVTGVSTNNCVSMTGMEASDRQYGVVLVSDATGTCSDEMQSSTEKTFRRMWGRVLSTAEVIAEMQSTAG